MTYEYAKANQMKLRYAAKKRGEKFSLWDYKEKKTVKPDYTKKYNHEYYIAHKEKINERSKKWMKENRKYHKEYYRRKKELLKKDLTNNG